MLFQTKFTKINRKQKTNYFIYFSCSSSKNEKEEKKYFEKKTKIILFIESLKLKKFLIFN